MKRFLLLKLYRNLRKNLEFLSSLNREFLKKNKLNRKSFMI